jgi:hypothetical protein
MTNHRNKRNFLPTPYHAESDSPCKALPCRVAVANPALLITAWPGVEVDEAKSG